MTMYEFIDGVFKNMSSSDFCGCHEGDLDDRYQQGVEKFKRLFADHLLSAIALDLSKGSG